MLLYTHMPPAFPFSFLNVLPLYLKNLISPYFQLILQCNKDYIFKLFWLLSAVSAFFPFICVICSLNMYLSTGVFNHHRDLFHFHVNELFFFFVQRGKHAFNIESTLHVVRLITSFPSLTLPVHKCTHITHLSS